MKIRELIALLEKMKKELLLISILLATAIVLFKIIFFNDTIFNVARIVLGLGWLLLPGFLVMYYWHEKLDFLSRLLLAVPVSFVIIGVSSYYFGLIGIHIIYHGVLIPLLWIITAAAILVKK